MSLPNYTNPSDISTFEEAQKYPDAKRRLRIKLVKCYTRYNEGDFSYAFNADEKVDITSLLINNGMSSIVWGIDDQEWMVGVVRNSNLTLNFDNTKGNFNDESDKNSYWFASDDRPSYVYKYYINNSALEIDFGFEVNDVVYWNSIPAFTGLIKKDNFIYKKKHVTFTVYGLLDWLQQIQVFERYNSYYSDRYTSFDALALNDFLFSNLETLFLPGDLLLTSAFNIEFISNVLSHNLFFLNSNKLNLTIYDYLQQIAKQSGNIFGINRKNEIFITNLNNEYSYDEMTPLEIGSGTINFWRATSGTPIILEDSVGGNDIVYNLISFAGSEGVSKPTSAPLYPGIELSADEYYLSTPDNWINDTSCTFEMLLQFNETGCALNKFGPALSNNISVIGLGDDSDTDKTLFKLGFNDRGLFGNLACGNIGEGETSKVLSINDGLWYYFVVVNDKANNTRSFFLNGELVYSTDYLNIGGLSTISMNKDYLEKQVIYDCKINIDTLKMSNYAKTSDEILDQTRKLFASKNPFNYTSDFVFSNHGSQSNINSLISYNNGNNKVFNVVGIDSTNDETWSTEFDVTFNSVATMFIRSRDAEVQEFTNIASVSDIKTNIEENFNNFICTITSNNVKISVYNDNNLKTGIVSFIDSAGTATGISSFTTLSDYKINNNYATVKFIKTKSFADYRFVNTASVYDLGKRLFFLNREKDNLIDSTFSQTSILANSFLEDHSVPKIRLEIETPFLEGNVDILQRVTVDWLPDYWHEGEVLESGAEWNQQDGAHLAGAITWNTKDFYVIGINHDFFKNKTKYKLREV